MGKRKPKASEALSQVMKLQPDVVVKFFAEFGILVDASFRSGGLSVRTLPDRTPVARLVPVGNGDLVEVLWWSYRDRWESIGDFGGIVMPLKEALQYILDDYLGCFWTSSF